MIALSKKPPTEATVEGLIKLSEETRGDSPEAAQISSSKSRQSARAIAEQFSGITAKDIENDREFPRVYREGKPLFDFDEVLEVFHQRAEQALLEGRDA